MRITIILCFFCQLLHAIPVEYITDMRKPADLWNISIDNNKLAIAYLSGTITSRQAGTIYKARTAHFQLPVGTQQIRHQLFKNIQVLQTTLEDFNIELAPGNYTFHTVVIDYYSNQILGEVSLEIQLADFDKKTIQPKTKQHKNIDFQIQATIDNRSSHDFKTNYNANEYTRFIINPSLTLYDIPLTAHAFVTTENNKATPNSNQFHLKFDAQKFQQLLLEKCLNYFKENENVAERKKMIADLKTETAQEKIKDYHALKKRLDDPDLQKTLATLEEEEALENILQDKVLKKKYVALEKLEKQVENGGLQALEKPLKKLEANGVDFNSLQKIYNQPEVLELIKKQGSKGQDKIHKSQAAYFKKEDFKQIEKLIAAGLDKPEEVKQLHSYDNFWQNLHFKKEYKTIKNKYENLKEKKKQYRKLLKVKRELDAIEGSNMQTLLSNPETLKKFATRQGLLNQPANILSNFNTIEVGNLYPIYNQLMLNGVSCKGANVEWNPGIFFVGVLSGKTIEQVFTDTILQNNANNKTINAVKIGLGNKLKNHIHFNYLDGKGATVVQENKLTDANQILGVDFSYLFINKINFSGELNHSVYHPDKNAPEELKEELAQKAWAGLFELRYFGNNGNYYFKATQINPQYKTLGLPYLLNDQISIETGFEKSFLKNQLATNFFIRKESGSGNLTGKTTAKSANGNLIYAPVGKPFINLFYNLLDLDAESFDNDQRNISHNVSITSGHNYPLKNTLLYSQLSYAYQYLNSESLLSFSDSIIITSFTHFYEQQAHSVSFSQQIKFKKLNLNTSGSWNKYDIKSTDNLYTLETNIGFSLFNQKLKTMFGIVYAGQGSAWKRGCYSQLAFHLTKHIHFNFHFQYEELSANTENKETQLQGLNFKGRLNFRF